MLFVSMISYCLLSYYLLFYELIYADDRNVKEDKQYPLSNSETTVCSHSNIFIGIRVSVVPRIMVKGKARVHRYLSLRLVDPTTISI